MAARSPPGKQDLTSPLSTLSISSKPPQKPQTTVSPPPESWEETSSDPLSPSTPSFPPTNAPPPTPIHPSHNPSSAFPSADATTWENPYSPTSTSSPRSRSRDLDRDNDERRPEKTTAAAGRLIAGALGVKAPKKSEEEKRYERVLREKERSRREEKKREGEEAERRKREVWDD